jgi:hypothetical protein
MTRSIRFPKVSALLATLVAVLTGAAQAAQAQVKPFKVTGGGVAPKGISLLPGTPAPHSAVGTATELGRYAGEGNFQILKLTSAVTADFSSAPDFTFTAANGDKLVFTYGDVNNGAKKPGNVTLTPLGMVGTSTLFTAVFVAEFNPVPAKCTGRFKKVIGGSFIMVAVSKPFALAAGATQTTPFEYTWQGDGSIQYGK